MRGRTQELLLGVVVAEEDDEDGDGGLALLSVLDLLSDEAAGLDSALPPAPFGAPSFDADSVAFDADSVAFFRAADG